MHLFALNNQATQMHKYVHRYKNRDTLNVYVMQGRDIYRSIFGRYLKDSLTGRPRETFIPFTDDTKKQRFQYSQHLGDCEYEDQLHEAHRTSSFSSFVKFVDIGLVSNGACNHQRTRYASKRRLAENSTDQYG